jgi:integrase
VLSEVELRRLNKAISAEEDVIVAAAFRLMLETGARAGEVLAAKWEDMDLKGLRWRLPSPKAGIPQTIFLAPQTAKWLKKVPRVDKNPYVIPGEIEGARRFDLKRAWRRMQRNAAIPGVNIHDLRRTVGKLIAREAGLQAAQKALRHSDVQLTASTYAPMQEAEVREAMAKVIPLLRRTA